MSDQTKNDRGFGTTILSNNEPVMTLKGRECMDMVSIMENRKIEKEEIDKCVVAFWTEGYLVQNTLDTRSWGSIYDK